MLYFIPLSLLSLRYLLYNTSILPSLVNTPIGWALLSAIEAIAKLRAISGGVDKGRAVFGESHVAAILLGVIGGA